MPDGNSTDLVAIEPADALAVFTTPERIDPILARVRAEIDGFTPDVTTKRGRDEIASIAYRVARSKTYLDGVGKALADEQKEIPKKIDASRKRIRDTLDQWKDEVRAPLTAWEQAEKDRVDKITADLDELRGVIADTEDRPSQAIRDRLAEVRAEAITDDRWNEFVAEAATLKDKAVEALEARLVIAEKREAEAAELARLRAEAEAREAQERERQIAEAAAKAERDKAEAAAMAAEQEARRKEAEHKAALEAAERKAVEAAQRAKAEAEAEKARELAAKAARAADREHRARIFRAALSAFVDNGVSEDVAKQIITLIAGSAIPNVTINY
jgi:chromosome segregation ATPase